MCLKTRVKLKKIKPPQYKPIYNKLKNKNLIRYKKIDI